MSIEDTLIRRQIFVQRFANGRADEAAALLQTIYARIEARLLREPTEFQAARLTILRDDINILLNQGFDELSDDIITSMIEFTESEADFSLAALSLDTNVALITPTLAQIEQAVLNVGMDVPVGPSSLTLNEAIAQFEIKKSIEIRTVINDAILTGQTTGEAVAEIRRLGVTRHRAQVEALVRTATNHAASMARKAISKSNAEILKGEEWVATLDSRTSLICAGRDGRIFPVGKGPFPPAHWNCRSVRVPVLKDEFDLSRKGARRPEIGEDGRGTTSANTKFDGWLRRQPADFQDEYFSQFADGPEKAALFRRGGLSIQQFRNETGVNYTLEQLAALEPQAFAKANIEFPDRSN